MRGEGGGGRRVNGVDFGGLGIAIGHATDEDGGTGLTVVRGLDGPRRGAAHVIGRASGTRELHVLHPEHLVDRVDAILLTGGSAYGLDAAAGVMKWMEEDGRGFPAGPGVVPIVPAAVIYDLTPCGRFDARPNPEMAYAACRDAVVSDVAEGSIGAGTGATVGKGGGIERAMKGGVGCAVERSGGLVVGAISVVNAFGDVRDGTGAIVAGARSETGFADTIRWLTLPGGPRRFSDAQGRNTTISVVMTNVAMDKVALTQVARAASAAYYQRITPVGTAFDGDIIFALCPLTGPTGTPLGVEALAARALSIAIERAVRLARGRDGVPGLADLVAPPSR